MIFESGFVVSFLEGRRGGMSEWESPRHRSPGVVCLGGGGYLMSLLDRLICFQLFVV